MIEFAQDLLRWLVAHPWTLAGSFVLSLALLAGSTVLNPDGRQLREKLRRRR